jgi:hypothetical protein
VAISVVFLGVQENTEETKVASGKGFM